MRKADWKKRKYTQEEFIQAWLTSRTIGEVARKLGRNHSGGGYVILKTAAQELNLIKEIKYRGGDLNPHSLAGNGF